MGNTKIKKSIYIDAPMKTVYDYFINPENGPYYRPGVSKPETLIGHGEVGTRFSGDVSMFGLHERLTMEMLENSISPEECMTKMAVESKDGTIFETTTMIPKNTGCEVTIEVDNTISGGILEKMFDKLILEKLLGNMYAHTLKNLKLHCEAL